MTNILDKICADKRASVEKLKKLRPFDLLHEEALKAPPSRGFLAALKRAADHDGAGFIAEIKKASPSAGLIRPFFSPQQLADAYAHAGAACLSVLTEGPHFQGKNEDLIEARAACDLPVLRKDFILDIWQITEARTIGADCILLILAALTDDQATTLCRAAQNYGMDVLLEVHDEDELARALKLPSPLVGVNSRNLKTLEISLQRAEKLVRSIPPDYFVVSESGLRTEADIRQMTAAGAKGFLVGESLLKEENVGSGLKKLRGTK